MSRHLTPDAARRLGDAARKYGDTASQLSMDIDDWFAAVYGWPLSRKEAEQRDEFLAIAQKAREGE